MQPEPVTDRSRWLTMTPTERKLVRRTQDWRPQQNQLTFADVVSIRWNLLLVAESAADASVAIKRMHRSIWFSLKGD